MSHNGPFHTIDTDEFFKQAKAKGEYLGVVSLHKDQCDFSDTVPYVTAALESYFTAAFHKFDKVNSMLTQVRDDHFPEYQNMTKESNYQLLENDILETLKYMDRAAYLYIKCVWSTRELLTDGSFYDIAAGHWDPQANLFHITPGGHRKMTYYLFGDDPTPFIMFNTGGIELPWDDRFDTYKDMRTAYSEYRSKDDRPHLSKYVFDGAQMYYRAWHNTIIPYIHSVTIPRVEELRKYNAQIHEFYRTTKINANFDLTAWHYDPALVTDHKRTLNVEIAEDNAEHMIKAFMLMPTHDTFEGFGVKITCV